MRYTRSAGWRYVQYVLCGLCIVCALLLMVLSLNGRTVWTPRDSSLPVITTVPVDWPQGESIRDAAGWDWIARGAGMFAIICLSIALVTSRCWLMLASTMGVCVALGWAALVAGQFRAAIAQGLVARPGWTTHVPAHVGTASQAAAVASMIGVVLLVLSMKSTINKNQSQHVQDVPKMKNG